MFNRSTIICLLLSCFALNLSAQDFTVYKSFDSLEKRLKQGGDTTFVVNFWATWCKPCVAELPYFEAYHENNKENKVKVLLVSLDFTSQIEKRVKPFLEKKEMKSEILLLADQDANTWIPKVDTDWDGAIPATWIVQKDMRRFKQVEFDSYQELEDFIAL